MDEYAPPERPPGDGRLRLIPFSGPIGATYPASPYQRRLWSLGAESADFQAQGELHIEGCEQAEALFEALGHIVSRHGALRTRLSGVPHPPFLVQTVAAAVPADNHAALSAAHQELEASRHRLTLRASSAVLDPPSFAIVARELAAVLGGAALDPDPVQFVEFSDWRNEVAGDAPAAGEDLVAARPRGFAAHRARLDFPAATREALASVARSCGVPADDVLLAAWMTYQWRSRSERTVTVHWAHDSRRADPALLDVVGRVCAYLPVTAALSGGLTFGEAVGRVSEARGVTAAAGERVLANATAGAAAFDIGPAGERCTVGGVTVGLDSADARTEPFGQRLTWEAGRGRLALELDAARWPPAAAERILAGLVALADAAAADPATPLRDLPMLGDGERAWLARVSHGPRSPIGEPVIARIADAARAHPERVAVRDPRTHLRYGDLLERAMHVAGALTEAGVRRGDSVVVVADRSVWSLTAILGVMLAGAAYVPLDESLPAARRQRIIDDCRARAVLARGLAEHPGPVPLLDPATATAAGAAPAAPRTLDDTAYILYTSGSTGRPKGVIVGDRGLANYAGWAAGHYGLAGPGDALVTSSFGFDLTVTTLLVPLTVGGTVVITSDASPLEVSIERGVCALKLTPRHLDLLASRLSAAEAGLVSTVVVGGEQLGRATVERWQRLSGGSLVVNEYGPTETVVGSAYHDLTADGDDRPYVPIGRPVANSSLYVLDQALQPVPCGVVGELFIAGAGVARGYLGEPAQTAERFLPDPFTDDGATMYRTGDLVRRDHDGDLTYVGRADDQLKIRGYRVEPGEVEQVILTAGGVHAAAVAPSGQALVAFIVPDGEHQDDAALLGHVAPLLPDYMVPARFVRVHALPLTPNGKVDRAALARRARQSPGTARRPETEMERLVEEVWSTVLDVELVGLDESFFEVGGESLLAIEVMRHLQERLDRKLRVATLFEHPTVRRLAAYLAGQRQEDEAERAGLARAARRAQARTRPAGTRRQS